MGERVFNAELNRTHIEYSCISNVFIYFKAHYFDVDVRGDKGKTAIQILCAGR